MPAASIFLDTNVFLYAAGREHPLRSACRNVLARVAEGEIAVTSSEVLQEILHVLARRNLRREAVDLTRGAMDLVSDVLAVGRLEVALACDLVERHSGLNLRDAIHLATLQTHGIATLVSADRHFDGLPGVTRIDPADFERRGP